MEICRAVAKSMIGRPLPQTDKSVVNGKIRFEIIRSGFLSIPFDVQIPVFHFPIYREVFCDVCPERIGAANMADPAECFAVITDRATAPTETCTGRIMQLILDLLQKETLIGGH